MISSFIFLSSLFIAWFSIRPIIFISSKKNLFDEPLESRKIHLKRTPNLGGVAIFISVIFTSILFLHYINISNLNYVLASAIILFALGLADDLVGVKPLEKISVQFVVASITTLLGGFRLTGLYGLGELTDMSYIISIIISILFIILLINAFNLIDGINCLAGAIGLLICVTFAYCFWKMNQTGLSILAISMCGSLAGFLYYNRTPARIFMGDCGSMFIGFIIAILSINFIELNTPGLIIKPAMQFKSAIPITIGLLIIPIFDTLRVFMIRVLNQKSPFQADTNHIHHKLIGLKLSHMQATGILILVNLSTLFLAFLFRDMKYELSVIIILFFMLTLNWIAGYISYRKYQKMRKVGKSKEVYPGNGFKTTFDLLSQKN